MLSRVRYGAGGHVSVVNVFIERATVLVASVSVGLLGGLTCSLCWLLRCWFQRQCCCLRPIHYFNRTQMVYLRSHTISSNEMHVCSRSRASHAISP